MRMMTEDDGRKPFHLALDKWLEEGGNGELKFRFGEPQDCERLFEIPWPKVAPMRRGAATEAFEKLVPVGLRPKKTGLNIALIADFNIAGRMTGLCHMLNRRTIHRARCIIQHEDYLSYDRDIVLDGGVPENIEEVMAIIDEADIFHFGRAPQPILGIDWMQKINKNNCLIQYFGSEIRHFGPEICDFHNRTRILGISAWDYTMLQPHPLIYHVNNFFDHESVDMVKHEDGLVRICHATTNRAFKQSAMIRGALRSVAAKTGAEIEIIEGKSYRECLELKKRCHITVDQLSSGIYGLSAIESMAMGHAVLCGMSNFAMSYYPDCPVVSFSGAASLEEKLIELVTRRSLRTYLGKSGRAFVERTCDPFSVLRQHCWLYDLVVSGHRFVHEPDEHILVDDA